MKKTTAFIMALTMMAALVSCNGTGSDVNPDTANKETAAQTEEVTTVPANTGDEEEFIEVTKAETTPAVTRAPMASVEGELEVFDAEPSEDFEGRDSEKYINALTSGKYSIEYDDDLKLSYDSETGNIYTETLIGDSKLINIYKDGILYTVSDGSYTKEDYTEAESKPSVSENRFEGYGYVGSSEASVDGNKYKYDEFRRSSDDTVLRIFLNDKNEAVYIQTSFQTMKINKFETEFDAEKVFALPSGVTEKDILEFQEELKENVDQVKEHGDSNAPAPAETDSDDL